ncbi:MAG: ABC transporter ATP-binding protein [Planctomycetota bacterium]
MSTSEPTISIRDFCKSYGEDIAADHISFEIPAGRILGLIGPNGAGKTTTMRALTGIIPSSGGTLNVCGYSIDENPLEVKQRTAYVPDDPRLFNDLTVREHFAFTAGIYNVDQWHERMLELAARFDLTEKLDARAADLSRGMRQKLAICCAYLYEPRALLLDEPMTGLDPRGIRMLKNSIVEQAERGAAVIISSHLLAMVEDICNHVLILEKGRTRFHGSLEELRAEFAGNQSDTTLEDIFFKTVESTPVPIVDLPPTASGPFVTG